MNLRNKVLKQSRIAYLLLVIGVIGLAALFYYVSNESDIAIRILGIVFMVITALYAIPIFFLGIPTRSFDRYYETLSKAERERFETELESRYCNRECTITSEEIVIVNFISIRVIEIRDILSMKKMQVDRKILLNMKSGKAEVIIEMPDYKVDMIVQDLLERNPNIVQMRF